MKEPAEKSTEQTKVIMAVQKNADTTKQKSEKMKRSSSPVIKLGENKMGTWRMVSPRTHPKLSQEKQWGQITIESNELVEHIGKTLFVVIYTKPPEIRLHENPEPEKEEKKV